MLGAKKLLTIRLYIRVCRAASQIRGATEPEGRDTKWSPEMLADWNVLSDDLQLLLSREALRQAAEIIAEQAEALAGEMEGGYLRDQGGPDALRLLAGVVRVNGHSAFGPVGRA